MKIYFKVGVRNKVKKYKIRFNYKYAPYVWIRVPKFIWALFNSSDLFVDTATQK
tara:strand:+ start:1618 stop:1779 length:162 start_codon:yes stop_codon:yes gene_type:complete